MKYRSLKHWKYELLEPEFVDVRIGSAVDIRSKYITLTDSVLAAKAHYAWDGPSGPTFDTDTFMRGSLFHDALCQFIESGALDRKYRKYADELLRQICLEDGMGKFRAWYVYNAVRVWSKLKGYK